MLQHITHRRKAALSGGIARVYEITSTTCYLLEDLQEAYNGTKDVLTTVYSLLNNYAGKLGRLEDRRDKRLETLQRNETNMIEKDMLDLDKDRDTCLEGPEWAWLWTETEDPLELPPLQLDAVSGKERPTRHKATPRPAQGRPHVVVLGAQTLASIPQEGEGG